MLRTTIDSKSTKERQVVKPSLSVNKPVRGWSRTYLYLHHVTLLLSNGVKAGSHQSNLSGIRNGQQQYESGLDRRPTVFLRLCGIHRAARVGPIHVWL